MAPFYTGQFYLVLVKGELVLFRDTLLMFAATRCPDPITPKKRRKKRQEDKLLSEPACCEHINRGTTSFLLPGSASELAVACIRALLSSQADGCFSAD